jgi:quercetin dioxygenase-like cupin family protein
MKIYPAGSRPSETASPEYFTGTVRMDPVVSAPDPARVRAAMVTFEPAARTVWHTHPLGQTLLVMSGRG